MEQNIIYVASLVKQRQKEIKDKKQNLMYSEPW